MSSSPADIFDFSPRRLQAVLAGWGEPAFRTAQVIAAAWRSGQTAFSRVHDLPKDLRRRLDETFLLTPLPKPQAFFQAPDQTVKVLFRFEDGVAIECVAIPLGARLTFCLSTQSGCALGCRFCATSRLGQVRNLTAGQIVAQVRGLTAVVNRPPTNLVLMGMGEPLQNLAAVRDALDLLGHPQALNWSAQKTTVSTSGWVPGLEILAQEPLRAKLAFSLNAVRDDLRNHLMPVNRRYPLAKVMAALKTYLRATGQSLTVEYVLLAGVNDSLADASRLGRMFRSWPSKINLIPFNAVAGSEFHAPGPEAIAAFRREVRRYHPLVTLRASRGDAIRAACGQLAGNGLRRAA